MIDFSVLQRYSLFEGFGKEHIDKILPFLKQEEFDAGADIIIEGKQNDRLWLILEGRVAAVKNGIILMEICEGSVFGEVEMLDADPAEATIKALATTKVLSLSIDALEKIQKSELLIYSILIKNLAKDLSRRLRRMDNLKTEQSHYMEWN